MADIYQSSLRTCWMQMQRTSYRVGTFPFDSVKDVDQVFPHAKPPLVALYHSPNEEQFRRIVVEQLTLKWKRRLDGKDPLFLFETDLQYELEGHVPLDVVKKFAQL